MTRILLVDDHSVVREGLRAMLGREEGLEVVGQAGDPVEALEAFRRLAPDLVLLDLQMPGGDGKDLIPRFLDMDPRVRILVLTTFGTEEDVSRSLALGARGYLLKSTPARGLVDAVRRVSQGGFHVCPEVLDRVPGGPRPRILTERETDVMRLVSEGRTSEEIVDLLDISSHTLKTHFTHILSKLGARDRAQALVAVLRLGLIRIG
jgi:two-component system NarL family response regulator